METQATLWALKSLMIIKDGGNCSSRVKISSILMRIPGERYSEHTVTRTDNDMQTATIWNSVFSSVSICSSICIYVARHVYVARYVYVVRYVYVARYV